MAVKIQDRVGGKKKTNPTSEDRLRPRDDTRPKDWSPYGGNNTSNKKPSQGKTITSVGPGGTRKTYKRNLPTVEGKDFNTGKSSSTQSILRAAMKKASERSGTTRKLSSDSKSVNTVSKAADSAVRKTTAAYKGYSGQSLRSSGEGKRYVSGEEYETYRKAKVQKQKDTEADRIKEAERRAAAGEPLRAKGEEKRYVSGAEYEAYRKAKNKAKKGK